MQLGPQPPRRRAAPLAPDLVPVGLAVAGTRPESVVCSAREVTVVVDRLDSHQREVRPAVAAESSKLSSSRRTWAIRATELPAAVPKNNATAHGSFDVILEA